VEYQVASHLIRVGEVDAGLDIVRAARRRYDRRLRNPFDEVEAGHWYARAMSSYALLQACSGARFDAVDRVLYLKPAIKGDFRCFLSTATGYGTVGVKDGKPFVELVSGEIPCVRIAYSARDDENIAIPKELILWITLRAQARTSAKLMRRSPNMVCAQLDEV